MIHAMTANLVISVGQPAEELPVVSVPTDDCRHTAFVSQ